MSISAEGLSRAPLVGSYQRSLLTFALALTATGVGSAPAVAQAQTDGARPVLVVERPPLRSVNLVEVSQLRAAASEWTPLQPDRRFLLAIPAVYQMLTGDVGDTLRVTWDGERWELAVDGLRVGSVSESDGFDALFGVLVHWATELGGDKGGLVAGKGDQSDETDFEPSNLAAELREIDESWAREGRSARLAAAGARALLDLTLQWHDLLETGDALPARALAASAVAEALGENVDVEVALLAQQMGYLNAGARRARGTLRGSAAWTHLLDDPHPNDEIGGPRSGYLAYRREVHGTSDLRSWHRASQQRGMEIMSSSALAPALNDPDFARVSELGAVAPVIALFELWQENGDTRLAEWAFGTRLISPGVLGKWIAGLDIDISAVATDFESELTELEPRYDGPFLPAEAYKAYFRGHFYSALYRTAVYRIDGLSSIPAAEELLAGLEGSPLGAARDLHTWFGALTASEAGRVDSNTLFRDLKKLEHLGAAALERTFEEATGRSYYGDARPRLAGRQLFQRLDTRPAHRWFAAGVAHGHVFDLSQAERLYGEVAQLERGTTPQWSELWHARLRGDVPALEAWVNDESLALGTRIDAIRLLAGLTDDIQENGLLERWSKLVMNSSSWQRRRRVIEKLEEFGEHEAALDLATSWSARWGQQRGIGAPISARTAAARQLQRMGRPAEALTMMAGLADTDQAGAMGRTALILLDLGRAEEAQLWADRLHKRYPASPFGRRVLAEVQWSRGQLVEAAKTLKAEGYVHNAWDWREVAPGFQRVFGEATEVRVKAAVVELLRAHVEHSSLGQLAFGLSHLGNSGLAFQVQRELPIRGLWELAFPVSAYTHLAASEDRGTALEWLLGAIPPNGLGYMSMFAYRQAPELLWDAIRRPEDLEYPEMVWLLRAAAAIEHPLLMEQHGAELRAHFATHSDTRYEVFGSHLMGLATEADVMEFVGPQDTRVEAAYYLALRAKADGDYPRASEWFRVALDTRLQNEGEYGWAFDELWGWWTSSLSLEALAEAGR